MQKNSLLSSQVATKVAVVSEMTAEEALKTEVNEGSGEDSKTEIRVDLGEGLEGIRMEASTIVVMVLVELALEGNRMDLQEMTALVTAVNKMVRPLGKLRFLHLVLVE
jgi:hypothetical protein